MARGQCYPFFMALGLQINFYDRVIMITSILQQLNFIRKIISEYGIILQSQHFEDLDLQIRQVSRKIPQLKRKMFNVSYFVALSKILFYNQTDIIKVVLFLSEFCDTFSSFLFHTSYFYPTSRMYINNTQQQRKDYKAFKVATGFQSMSHKSQKNELRCCSYKCELQKISARSSFNVCGSTKKPIFLQKVVCVFQQHCLFSTLIVKNSSED